MHNTRFEWRRLVLTYGVLGGVVAVFLLLTMILAAARLTDRFVEVVLSPSKLVHLVTAVVLLGVYRITRRAPRPRWVLSTIDLGGAFLLIASTTLMIALLPAGSACAAAFPIS